MSITNHKAICQNPKCNKNFIVKPNTRGKYCSLSCSTTHQNQLILNKKLLEYAKNPKLCLCCNIPIDYEKRNNKFCSQSCSAKYNNQARDYSKFKSGPTTSQIKLPKTEDFKYSKYNKGCPYTPITQCIICNKYHPKPCNTCSPECRLQYTSIRIKESIANGTFNPNLNRGRGKQSYLEKSFDDWLKKYFPNIFYHTEYKFPRLDIIKTYFVDFYFPTLHLIIELDGTQHLKTKTYDEERDLYISSTYNVEIIRISHSEYKNKTKIDLIRNKLC